MCVERLLAAEIIKKFMLCEGRFSHNATQADRYSVRTMLNLHIRMANCSVTL